MEIKKLKRQNLDYLKALEYFKDQLNCDQTLSKELLNSLNFKEGQFFTLLPEDADLSRIYDFFGGLILPQNPTCTYINESGKKSSYTWIPTLKKEISCLLFEKLKIKPNNLCVFEDVLHLPTDPHLEFFHRCGKLYLNEIYYYINNYNASPELIESAISYADAIWHLMFILTETCSSDLLGKDISLENIKEFAKNTQLLVLGAYDGEGYVFWEPNQ